MAATKWINFAGGARALEGWWLGADDSRPLESYVPAERWDEDLRSARFAGIERLVYDGYLNNSIVAMPSTLTNKPKRVTLLIRDPGVSLHDPVSGLERHLVQSGYRFDRLTLEEFLIREVPQDLDIVPALDLDGPFFKDLEEHKFRLRERFVRKVREEDHGVLWLTRASQVTTFADPEYGMVIGMARMLRNEADLDFATVEMESLDSSNLECVLSDRRLADALDRIVSLLHLDINLEGTLR